MQVHGLILELLNLENDGSVASLIGSCIGMDPEIEMQKRGYIRMKVEIDTEEPLRAGFWWTDEAGTERWEQVRYERLSDLCYGCGRLCHTTQACSREITLSEVSCNRPMYGP